LGSHNISATARASDFTFEEQLGLPRAIIKSHAEERLGVVLGFKELSKIWGFPLNIYTIAEASDFKFGTQLRFAKLANPSCVPNFKSLASGMPRPIIKTHP